jgi:hypothetical protein
MRSDHSSVLIFFSGYPYLPNLQLEPQFPIVAMLNWTAGAGTARYWASKLLIDTAQIDIDQASGFGPAIETELTSNTITLTPYAVAVVHMPPLRTTI